MQGVVPPTEGTQSSVGGSLAEGNACRQTWAWPWASYLISVWPHFLHSTVL